MWIEIARMKRTSGTKFGRWLGIFWSPFSHRLSWRSVSKVIVSGCLCSARVGSARAVRISFVSLNERFVGDVFKTTRKESERKGLNFYSENPSISSWKSKSSMLTLQQTFYRILKLFRPMQVGFVLRYQISKCEVGDHAIFVGRTTASAQRFPAILNDST